ncbi:hypothetical protein [Flavobacterium sp.]|uniref:hypothetical protein n=1 Tax=Flavobacterium sp. TaxID=239 RepID=UPI0025D3375A|nr:hypothetical protein [Flavobacterium sp.]
MKHILTIALFFWIVIVLAQTKLEITPQGLQLLELKTPNKPIDQLVELSKSWAPYYNKKGYDISEVTANSLTIEARVENAFYSYNVGVKYNHDVRYSLKILFREDKKYTLTFSVKEIYAENVLMKTTLADFFTSEGKLKDDFRDAKPSLENTINKIVRSYTDFITAN